MTISKIETNSLANTAVTKGDYGGASQIPSITINEKGQVTRAANVASSGGGGGEFNPFLLAGM